MTLGETMVSAWRQALAEGKSEVELGGRRYRVFRSRNQGLRVVSFPYGGETIEGIEQNPEKESRWALLAREGKRIMQFRCRGKFVGNVCEGELLRYPAWKGMGLPE